MNSRLSAHYTKALEKRKIDPSKTDFIENMLLMRAAGIKFSEIIRRSIKCEMGDAVTRDAHERYRTAGPYVPSHQNNESEQPQFYFGFTGINENEAKNLLSYFNSFGDWDACYFINAAYPGQYIFEADPQILATITFPEDLDKAIDEMEEKAKEIIDVYVIQTQWKKEQERAFAEGAKLFNEAKVAAFRRESGKPNASYAIPSNYVRITRIAPEYIRPAAPGAIVRNKQPALNSLFKANPYKPFTMPGCEVVSELKPPMAGK